MSLSNKEEVVSFGVFFLQYLRETLQSFICELLDSDEDCEVDPTKLAPGANLPVNQAVLVKMVRKVWMDILMSWNRFPR